MFPYKHDVSFEFTKYRNTLFRPELFTLLSVYKYVVFVKAVFAFPLKREKFLIVTLYSFR